MTSSAKKSWDLISKSQVPQKVKLFAWRVASNNLATQENKKKRNIMTNDAPAPVLSVEERRRMFYKHFAAAPVRITYGKPCIRQAMFLLI